VQFHLFDYLTLQEWDERQHVQTTSSRRSVLELTFGERSSLEFLRLVPQLRMSAEDSDIRSAHDEFVADGFEGVMVKNPDAGYTFGRSYDVMKLKAFHDVDLVIVALVEGTGKHEGRMGAVAVRHNGLDVQVGSGFTDELRKAMWSEPASYVGRTIEVQYQEETKDGSLRFPTFVRFRDDK
jgi:DNA ligase-1